MAFSEEIKIEAVRNPRDSFRRDLHSILLAVGRDQAQRVARWLPEPGVPGQEAFLPMSSAAVCRCGTAARCWSACWPPWRRRPVRPASCWWWTTAVEDGAPDLARSARARVIPMGRNAGFAAAVNRGIRESRGEWIAVLNSDVELAPDYFERLSRRPDGWFATGRDPASRGRKPDRRHLRRSPVAAAPPGARETAGSTGLAFACRAASGPRPGRRPCFVPRCSVRSACWKRASNRIWKMSISGCAAPRAGCEGEYRAGCRRAAIMAARHWGAGIRKRCG